MSASLTCSDCGGTAPAAEGYLRPEGFVCGVCWARRLEDPAFVRSLEQQLEGLVATVGENAAGGGPGSSDDQAIPAPRTGRDRRAWESLQGLAVADALGAAFEGAEADPARETGPVEPARRPAPWTDDTQMALSIVEVLERHRAIEPDALAAAFALRYEAWRGYGFGMRRLLEAVRAGQGWRKARHSVFRDGSFGNGSAMRAGPLGAYFHDARVDEVAAQADLSAEVTHAHPEGRTGAVAVALAPWLAARSRGAARGGSDLLRAVASQLPAGLAVTAGVARVAALPPETPLPQAVAALGNGSRISCPDTVPLALWLALHGLGNYELAVRKAITAGGDTDTTAAIVGSIVAAHGGVAGIPERWLALVEPIPLAR